MSISDIKMRNRSAFRGAVGMLAATAFCLVFARVYNLFGHGVTSPFMNLQFLFPLFGLIVYLVACFSPRLTGFHGFQAVIFNAGIITSTLGSILRGVFDIAGTASPLLCIYAVAGGMLTLAGLVMCFAGIPDRP